MIAKTEKRTEYTAEIKKRQSSIPAAIRMESVSVKKELNHY